MTTKRFSRLLLTMFGLSAIVLLSATLRDHVAAIGDRLDIQSVTRVNNLEVTGTTDATGVITARAGVRLTTPTTGPIFTSGAGTPNAVVTATQGSLFLRTDTATIYTNTNGAMAWTQVDAAGGTVTSITFSGGLTATSNPTTTSSTASIATDGVTTAKILDANVTTSKILDANVTLAKMANLAQSTILGRAAAAGTGVPTALTATQATAILDLASTSAATKGLVPGSSGGGASVFLNGNLGWTAPAGGVTSITCSTGLSCTASNPITSTGTITANLAGASCSAGQFVSAISATGTGTCTAQAAPTFSGAQVYRNAGVNISTGASRTNLVQATVAYDTSSYRHGGGGIEDAKLYAPSTGYYLITAYLEWTGCSTAAGIQGIYFNKNAGGDVGLCERPVNSTNDAIMVCTATALLASGDYVIEQVAQTTGNNCTANTQSRSPYSMSRLGI